MLAVLDNQALHFTLKLLYLQRVEYLVVGFLLYYLHLGRGLGVGYFTTSLGLLGGRLSGEGGDGWLGNDSAFDDG